MTAQNQWTSDQLATLQGYINTATADLANGDLKSYTEFHKVHAEFHK